MADNKIKAYNVKSTEEKEYALGDMEFNTENNKKIVDSVKYSQEKEFSIPIAKFDSFRLEMDLLMLHTSKSIYLLSAE